MPELTWLSRLAVAVDPYQQPERWLTPPPTKADPELGSPPGYDDLTHVYERVGLGENLQAQVALRATRVLIRDLMLDAGIRRTGLDLDDRDRLPRPFAARAAGRKDLIASLPTDQLRATDRMIAAALGRGESHASLIRTADFGSITDGGLSVIDSAVLIGPETV